MFLEHYKLESNPFAPRQARPRIRSAGSRAASVAIGKVLDRSLFCLFLSGQSGVGKTALVERHLRGHEDLTVSLIGPGILTALQFMTKVLRDVGLPSIDASVGELRNILEVYLRHQMSKGLQTVLVADSLERIAEPVLNELESLTGLRYKSRPIMSFILLTRSEELARNMEPRGDKSSALARHAHVRVTGFTLDETVEYITACLQSVGGQDTQKLFPEQVLADIQAYTQGIVGDINTLCFEALNVLAYESETGQAVGLSSAAIARAAERLNLHYEPAFSRNFDDALSPESIQQSDPTELKLEAASLLVTSRGNVIAEIALNRPRMVLGRDESCDISLDSSYVSRYQNLFMETADGWLLIDLSSTNGCFVNGRRVTHHELRDGDIIAVGHHQINFVGSRAARSASRSDIAAGQPTAGDTLVSPLQIGKRESA
jgi:general secretion pathway protein A